MYYYKDLLVPSHNQSIFIRYLKEDKEPFIFPPPPHTNALMDQAHVSELIYSMVNSLNKKAAHHPMSERPAFDITLENDAEPSVILSKISKHKRPKRRGKCPRLAPRDDGPFKRVNYIDRSKSLHQLKYSSVKPKHMPKKSSASKEKVQIEKPKETIDNMEPIDHLSKTKQLSNQHQADNSVQTPESNVLNHGHEEVTDLPAPYATEAFSHDKDGNGESDLPLNDIENKEFVASLEKDIPENDETAISEHSSLNQETEANQIDILNEVPHHTGTDYPDQVLEADGSKLNEEPADGSVQSCTTAEHVDKADDHALAAEPDESNEYEYTHIPEDMLTDEIEDPNVNSEKIPQYDMMIEHEWFYEDHSTAETKEAEYQHIEEITFEESKTTNEYENRFEETPSTDPEDTDDHLIKEVTLEEPEPANEHETIAGDIPSTETEKAADQHIEDITFEESEPDNESETLTEDIPSMEIKEVTLEEPEPANEHETIAGDIPSTETEEAADQHIEEITFEESEPDNESATLTEDIPSMEIEEVIFEESEPESEHETLSEEIPSIGRMESDDESIEESSFEESVSTHTEESGSLDSDTTFVESEETTHDGEVIEEESAVSQEVDSGITTSVTEEFHAAPVDDHHPVLETHVVNREQDLLSDNSTPEESDSTQDQVPEENTTIEHGIDSLIEETPSELNEEPVEESIDQHSPTEIDSSRQSDLATTPSGTQAEIEDVQDHHPIEIETDDNGGNGQDLLSDNITAEEFETASEEMLVEKTIVDNDEIEDLNDDTPALVQEEIDEEITQTEADIPSAAEAAPQPSTPSESAETQEETPAKVNSGSSRSIPAEETETAGDPAPHTTQDQNVEESYTTILNKYFTLGDKINVYAGSKLLDKQGTFLTAGRDFFIWIDADGYVRLQVISGGISIGQKKRKK
ncbi:hypothetical protein AAEO50_06975 [Rossellomorea oryzaecorticis]|uniref:Uncharacterized protein n=1 Tax=Rossellomorea oryzaecorticis TaxID=1396505 RepID=A0ABU9K7F0_9BACI